MVVVGLGTNLGSREESLTRAVAALGGLLRNRRCSPVYESKALLPEIAPDTWDKPFLNMAVAGETELEAHALLAATQEIERSLGRTPRGHWGPREIDIDILAYGDQVINEADLIVPHAALLMRDFALVPLADIAPDWVYPSGEAKGKTARELARKLPCTLTKMDIVIA